MSRLNQEIENLVLKNLPDDTHFIVDIKLDEKAGKPRLVILIDSDQGVTIDTCARISRSIAEEIETSEWIADAFVLEVSSPGLDFPLSSPRQYRKNIGRELKLSLSSGVETSGKLIDVLEEGVKLLVRKKEKGKKATEEEALIPFADIKKSIVQVSFK